MSKPQLSIIIPAYNCGDSIVTIVKSITQQPFSDFELIIVNDKSTDHTADVLSGLEKTDNRIKIINQAHNGGAAVARNAGINKARGQYLMFLDADDNIKPDTIQQFINAINNPGIDLAVSGMTIRTVKSGEVLNTVDVCANPLPKPKANQPFKLYILNLLGLDGRLYQVWNKIYKADIIRKHKLQFQPGIDFGEDLLFNLDYFAHMTGQIEFIPRSLYIYNQSLDSGTFSQSSLVYANREQNYQALLDFASDLPETSTKISYLSWIKFSWLYSHLLAISQANLSTSAKLVKLAKLKNAFVAPVFSDQSVIGSKRLAAERMLAFVVKHPRLALAIINSSNFLKTSRLTASLWQAARRRINS